MADAEPTRTQKNAVVVNCTGFQVRFRLEDGQEVVAVVPKRVARDMFRIVPGDRVRVTDTATPKPRILGFAPRD